MGNRAYLEQVLLVTERLFLFLPQLVQRVVVTIVIDQLHAEGSPSGMRACRRRIRPTLWSRFTIVFLIRLQIPWSSRLGVITRDSMSSSSGASVSDAKTCRRQHDQPFGTVISWRSHVRLTSKFFHQLLILTDIVHSHFCLRVSRREIVFITTDGAEQGGKGCGKG